MPDEKAVEPRSPVEGAPANEGGKRPAAARLDASTWSESAGSIDHCRNCSPPRAFALVLGAALLVRPPLHTSGFPSRGTMTVRSPRSSPAGRPRRAELRSHG